MKIPEILRPPQTSSAKKDGRPLGATYAECTYHAPRFRVGNGTLEVHTRPSSPGGLKLLRGPCSRLIPFSEREPAHKCQLCLPGDRCQGDTMQQGPLFSFGDKEGPVGGSMLKILCGAQDRMVRMKLLDPLQVSSGVLACRHLRKDGPCLGQVGRDWVRGQQGIPSMAKHVGKPTRPTERKVRVPFA